MSLNKSKLLIAPMFALLFWLNARGVDNLRAVENKTASPTIETAITLTSPPPAASPTAGNYVKLPIIGGTLISSDQESRLVELLQSKDCELPCYLDITPGKTTWASAQQILSGLGAEYKGETYESGSGMPGYAYKLLIGELTSGEATSRSPLDITQSLYFLVKDSIVQKIGVSISTLSQESKFRNYWSRYSTQQIFIRLGSPNAIYYSPNDSNGMALVYKSLGVVMEFHGIRDGNTVCPNFEINGYTERMFVLTNTASTLSIFLPEDSRVPLTDRIHWLPVVEVLGISQGEFYNRIVSEPSTCFNVKLK